MRVWSEYKRFDIKRLFICFKVKNRVSLLNQIYENFMIKSYYWTVKVIQYRKAIIIKLNRICHIEIKI
jgi:hypothetical protein